MDWLNQRCARGVYPKFLVGAMFLCALVAQAQAQTLSPAKRAQIEVAVSRFMASTHVPGLSIAVVEDGKYEWAAGFGFADLENNIPASEHTLFRLASISKSLTAVGAMELWEHGKLELDSPIQKYCPSFPQKSAPITTRQVMGHLGGIRHYKSESQEDPEVGNTKHFDKPIQAGLDFFKNDPLVAEPGSHFHYSTQGYTVVGCIIEGASGSSYVDYMRQNVLLPAGMEQTQTDDRSAIIPYRTRFYQKTKSGTVQIRRFPRLQLQNSRWRMAFLGGRHGALRSSNVQRQADQAHHPRPHVDSSEAHRRIEGQLRPGVGNCR